MNWYPQAVVRPGPSSKIQVGRNPGRAVVCHSMVGFRGGAHAVLDNQRPPRETVAWHFSVLQDGTVEQHYPLDVRLHHAGNRFANDNYIGIEHEGGYDPEDEPLTAIQRAASVSLVKWIAAQRGWQPSRTGQKTLYEHHEVSDRATKCPSGRIPWGAYLIQAVPDDKPPTASPFDWAAFYANGAKPVRVEQRNPTTVKDVYEVYRYRKVK